MRPGTFILCCLFLLMKDKGERNLKRKFRKVNAEYASNCDIFVFEALIFSVKYLFRYSSFMFHGWDTCLHYPLYKDSYGNFPFLFFIFIFKDVQTDTLVAGFVLFLYYVAIT